MPAISLSTGLGSINLTQLFSAADIEESLK